jgi:GDP-L-fucose synthase
MRIFVTGGHGFLGRVLCRALAAAGHELDRPTRRECDLTDPAPLRKIAAERYDAIYHLAAWTQAGDFCLHHPGEQWIINQQINTNLLSWWATFQPRAKLVLIGSSCAYPTDGTLAESEYLSGEPTPSLRTYALTKRMLLEGARSLNQQYGLRYLALVPSTLYGPDYHQDGRQMHFIFDIARKIIRGREIGEPVVLWGDGQQRRELVHVDDFVRVLLELATLIDNDLVNIGAGEDHSIRELAAMLCEIVGYDASRIQYDATRYVGARSKRLHVGKLESLLPGVARLPLREGLRELVGWFYSSRAYL